MQTMIEFCLGHISEGAYNIKNSKLKLQSQSLLSGSAGNNKLANSIHIFKFIAFYSF